MSLIIEALKKARDDAMRRQAAARGLPLAPVPKLEGKNRWLNLALIPLVAALVVCVMLLLDAYSRVPAPAERDSGSQAVAAVESGGPIASTLNLEPEGGSLDPDTDQVQAVLEPGSNRPQQTGTLLDSAPQAGPSPVVPPSSTDASASAGELSSAEPNPATIPEGEVGTRHQPTSQARLAGGQIVDLGGIAWSESDPYALINGQVVGVGERVRTYRVTSITPSEVILESDDDRVVLRLE